MKIFPPRCNESNIYGYNRVITELNILHHHCINKNILKLTKIFKVSKELKHILPNGNKICRLIFTAPVSTASNDNTFSKLKIVKNFLRSTTRVDRLLNCNKYLTDEIDIHLMVKHLALLKERRLNRL